MRDAGGKEDSMRMHVLLTPLGQRSCIDSKCDATSMKMLGEQCHQSLEEVSHKQSSELTACEKNY